MESFGRQLEREGQLSPAANQDHSRNTSVSPIPVSTPTLPMRPAASSTPADVQAQESQHLKRLFRGALDSEACQNRLLLLDEIRHEIELIVYRSRLKLCLRSNMQFQQPPLRLKLIFLHRKAAAVGS